MRRLLRFFFGVIWAAAAQPALHCQGQMAESKSGEVAELRQMVRELSATLGRTTRMRARIRTAAGVCRFSRSCASRRLLLPRMESSISLTATLTGTYEFKVGEGLLTPLEYRRDWSNQPYLLTNKPGVLSANQDTLNGGDAVVVWREAGGLVKSRGGWR